jgi:anti-sigma factor RsiW
MHNELTDSQLSAYLDDELTGDERSAVEAQLRESAEDRQTLVELRQLRESFQALPQCKLDEGFASRVIEAAVAQQAIAQQHSGQQNTAIESARMPVAPAITPVERTPASRTNRRWVYVAGTVAAVAACWLVIVQLSGGPVAQPVAGPLEALENLEPTTAVVADEKLPGDSAFAVLRQSLPGEGEALIIRLRVPAGAKPADVLDAAMAQSGIRQLTPSEPSVAGRVGAAYRTAVREQAAPKEPGASAAEMGESASDALYVEAPLGLIEDALAVLADQKGGRLELQPEMRVAVASNSNSASGSGAEAEGGSGNNVEAVVSSEPFAQRLNSRMFRLPKASAPASGDKTDETRTVDANRKVRVLILVETIK